MCPSSVFSVQAEQRQTAGHNAVTMKNQEYLQLSKRLLSEKETAAYLGRSLWAIREMRYAGKLPFVKDGKRVLFDVLDLNDWIEKSKTQFTY